MARIEMNGNERRLVEANTALVDKNKVLLKDIKKLVDYINDPEHTETEEIRTIISYYENFTYY